MDLRNKTIQDLLVDNQQETRKWEQYREEQKTVETNLLEFQKKLEIDVLVPIGTKAFVPGVLYHTNEILVSHFQGYFSKVTTKTALEMVEHRVKLADNHLKKLEDEYKLFEPRLELPMIQDDGKEIIEEYNDEQEKLWRAKHRDSVRRMKLEERNKSTLADPDKEIDVMDMLEELELMEELEGELDKVKPEMDDTDDKLKRLMSGELRLPSQKDRIAHSNENTTVIPLTVAEVALKNQRANENGDDENDNEDDDDCDDIPPAIRTLVESTKDLTITEKLKIFRNKLKTVKQSIRTMKLVTESDLVEKLEQIEIKETLEEIIEDLEDHELDEHELHDKDDENVTEDEMIVVNLPANNVESQSVESPRPKKKYTFNENVDICYINSKDPPRKISDDRNPDHSENQIDRPALQKIEIPMIKPKIDYDPKSTFAIRFNHGLGECATSATTNQNCAEFVDNFTKDVISSPFEIYKLIKNKTDGTKPRKGKKGAKNVKITDVPVFNETEKPSKPLKSILKPGLVMNHEDLNQIDEECELLANEENGDGDFVVSQDFSKIMGEVTEHSVDPNEKSQQEAVLPQEKPAKISKFKLSRKKS